MILVSFAQDFRACFIEGFFIHRVSRKIASRAEVVKNLQVLCVGYFLHLTQIEGGQISSRYKS